MDYSNAIVLIIFITFPASYYAYKTKAGYKNEAAAKLILYQQMTAAVAGSFILLRPLSTISSTLQYVVSMLLLVGCMVTNYFFTKKIKQSVSNIQK